MSEINKLRPIDKIIYGLSLIAVLGALGTLAYLADNYREAVKSLPTPAPVQFETNYLITQICGTGAGTTRYLYHTENPPSCTGEVGARTCTIDGAVVEGFMSITLYQGNMGEHTMQVDGDLCTFSTIAKKETWKKNGDLVISIK